VNPGGKIDDEIAAAMAEAELFLLLISASFINSDYCVETEFKKALQRHAKGEVIIVPIILRDCDWDIDGLRQFKALPKDAKPVVSSHWHSEDEAFKDVVTGLRRVIISSQKNAPAKKAKAAKKKSPKDKFVPTGKEISDDEREKLGKVHEEIVNRLSAKDAKLPEEEFKKKRGKWFGILWNQFNEHFGTTEHGLKSLPADRFEDALSWLQQYRASKERNFKRTNPQKFRNSLTKTIYTISNQSLAWDKDQLYAFAAEKLGYASPIESLSDLGNNQLELVRDRIRYEDTKRKTKAKQAKAKRKSD